MRQLLNSQMMVPGGGAERAPDVGEMDERFLREMLAETRQTRGCMLTPIPEGLSDVRLYRVYSRFATVCLHLRASASGEVE